MTVHTCLALLVLSVAVLPGFPLVAEEPPPLPSQAELEKLLRARDVPGLSMAVLDGREVVDVVVAGTANLETFAYPRIRALAGFVLDSGEGLVILTNGSRGQEVIDAITEPPS